MDIKERNQNSKKLIGTYVFDSKKTNLKEYAKNNSKYKALTLNFYSDYTFKFNMKVPFIYTDIGMWEAAGSDLDEWNRLSIDGYSFAQVSRCCTLDSTIIMNSTTPQDGQHSIQLIFFKKL